MNYNNNNNNNVHTQRQHKSFISFILQFNKIRIILYVLFKIELLKTPSKEQPKMSITDVQH